MIWIVLYLPASPIVSDLDYIVLVRVTDLGILSYGLKILCCQGILLFGDKPVICSLKICLGAELKANIHGTGIILL